MARKALIVGIQYKGTPDEVGGSFNDLKYWKDFLENRGYEITKLREEDATKDRIKDEFRDLVRNAQAGDHLFFSFTGHGGQIEDSDDSESDGEDERLVTYDSGKIVDDFLKKKVSNLPAGVIFNGVICACHAGTPFDLKYNYRYCRGENGEKIYKSYADGNYDDIPTKVMILSPCGDSGNTYTHMYSGKKHGLLIAAFMDRFDSTLTYRKLLKSLWKYYEDVGKTSVVPRLSCSYSGLDDIMVDYGSHL